LNRNWNNVIFSDKTSFWTRISITRIWCIHANRSFQRQTKGARLGLFLKTGIWQFAHLHKELERCWNGQNISEGLLPSAKKWFKGKNKDWLLQEHNDPKHRSLCTAWKQGNEVDVLDWPSQSPEIP